MTTRATAGSYATETLNYTYDASGKVTKIARADREVICSSYCSRAKSYFAREQPLAVPLPADCQCLVRLFRKRELLVVAGEVLRVPR